MEGLTIGALRARLTLEAPLETPDDAGGVIRRFVAAASVWCEIATLNAQQRFEAEQIGQTVTHRITLRYRDSLNARHRFRRGDRIFLVRGVQDPDDRRRRLVCHCEELTP